MTVETFLVNSIEDRYGEEVALLVEKNLESWEKNKKPEENSRFAEVLKEFVYPYIAAGEILLNQGFAVEEIKALMAELIAQGPPPPLE